MCYIKKDLMPELINKIEEAMKKDEPVVIHIKNESIQLHNNCQRIDYADIIDDELYISCDCFELYVALKESDIRYDEFENGYSIINNDISCYIDFLY